MKKILRLILRFVNGTLSKLGYELHISRKGRSVIFDLQLLRSYFENNAIRQSYQEAIERCGGKDSDNIYKQFRFYAYAELAEYAAKKFPDKSFAECGCWKGHSTRMIARIMAQEKTKGRFLVFDSFEGGLSDFSKDDDSLVRPMTEKEKQFQKDLFRSTLEEVKSNLKEFSFIDYFAGWIPDRFTEAAAHEFAFVNIDVDLAAPVRDSINFFYPRLVKGGVMTFDEYGYSFYPGVKTEVDKYLKDNKPDFFFELPSGGAFLIK